MAAGPAAGRALSLSESTDEQGEKKLLKRKSSVRKMSCLSWQDQPVLSQLGAEPGEEEEFDEDGQSEAFRAQLSQIQAPSSPACPVSAVF